MNMTECKHCGQEIVKYSSNATDWDRIGDDDSWVHVLNLDGTKHLAQPEWQTKS